MKLRDLTLLAAGLAAAAFATTGCRTPTPTADAPAVLDALWPQGRATLPLAELAGRISLAPTESFRVDELARDAATSHHVVAIRRAEVPHRHDRHDLLVVLLSGSGSMRLGGETPAVAYAVYLPAFDGEDRAPVGD